MSHADFSDEGGEGYFASVSDLMVGILFVFLLMLTVFALNFRDAEDKQTVEKTKYEELLKEVEAEKRIAIEMKAKAEAQDAQNRRLQGLLEQALALLEQEIKSREYSRTEMLTKLKESLADRGVRVTLDTGSGILRLAGDLLFDVNASVLRPAGRQVMPVLSDALAEILPCYTGTSDAAKCTSKPAAILEAVLVEGHTDRQAYSALDREGSQARNDLLSTARALTVFGEMRRTRPSLELLRNADQLPLLAFSGYGERRPLRDALGNSPTDFEHNRRIDLRFVLAARTSDEVSRLVKEIRDALRRSP